MKQVISSFRKSMSEAGIWSSNEIETIWDFYVTKSVASSACQKRTAGDYGLKELPFDGLLDQAKVPSDKREMLMADTMNKTLKEYDFVYSGKIREHKDDDARYIDVPIEIDMPRILCLQPYSISDRGNPTAKGGGKAVTLLTHIRNSFAHGNTYFFDNKMALFEDRSAGAAGKTTAMILIPQTSVIDWIKMVDIDGRFYFRDEPRDMFKKYDIRLKDSK